jgi:plasmid stabilization system protein ParE
MSRIFRRNPAFTADAQKQFAWYWDKAGEDVAWKFAASVEQTILSLTRQPELGSLRRFKHPFLHGLRSFRVEPPFGRMLLFYRADEQEVEFWRLMHGARDLSRRLLEPPGSGED